MNSPCQLYILYIYIYIYILLLYRLSVPLSISPGKPYITSKVSINALKSREPPEPALLSHLRLAVHQTLRFPILQRRHVTTPHNNPMFFVHSVLLFSKSHWRPHSSYVFDMTPSSYNTCDHPRLPKLYQIQIYHKFPMDFNSFMLTHFDVVIAKLQKMYSTCRNMDR